MLFTCTKIMLFFDFLSEKAINYPKKIAFSTFRLFRRGIGRCFRLGNVEHVAMIVGQ